MNSLRTLFFLLLLAVPAMASAQSAPAAARPSGSPPPAAEPVLPAWDQLSPEQRDALVAPLRERWNDSPQERARMLEQRLARGRGRDAAALAHQQLRAHLVLELGQALADGRANHGLLQAYGGNVALFADGDKQPQGRQVEVAHARYSVWEG